jgi:nucleoside-diphosphate-sugar epimerase
VKRVALTGATGFVGARVLDHLLARGLDVAALARRPQPERPGVRWVAGDLDDRRALAALIDGVDAVVHIAGLIKARREGHFFDVNAAGTARLLDVLGDRPVRLIHLSSLAARQPALSAYAASKAAAERLVEGSAADWTVLRPPAVYGPGDRETLAFFKAARRRRPVLPGGPHHRTSLVHVSDLADAVHFALLTPVLSRRVAEVHDGALDGYAFPEVLAMIAGRDGWHRPLFAPAAALRSLGGASWFLALLTGGVPMLTPGKARELSFPDWVCRDRTMAEAGWNAAIPAPRGLAETRAWYEANGYL